MKVKVKSLAAEARIIRHEEKRSKDVKQQSSLHLHRTGVVREEARAALIAYGFIRGKKFSAIEPRAKSLPSISRVEEIALRFGLFYDWDEESGQEFEHRKQKFKSSLESFKQEIRQVVEANNKQVASASS